MAYSFGTYTFGKLFSLQEDDRSAELPRAKLARSHGEAAGTRKLKGKIIKVRGMFIKGEDGLPNTSTAVDDAMDTLAAALATGANGDGKASLFVRADGTRYMRNAQVDNLSRAMGPTADKRYCSVTVDFFCSDPLQYGTTPGTDTWNSPTNGGTKVVTVGAGTATAKPVLVFTLAGSADIEITVTNTTTGDFFTLSGTPNPAATVLTLDCLAQTLVDAGGNDQMFLFSESFLNLQPGANSLVWTVNTGNAATVNSVGFSWIPRWY